MSENRRFWEIFEHRLMLKNNPIRVIFIHDARHASIPSALHDRPPLGGTGGFTRDEAASALGITTGGFLKAAERQQRRNALLNPRHGFYVVCRRSTCRGERRRPPGTLMISCATRRTLTTWLVEGRRASRRHASGRHGVSSRHRQAYPQNSRRPLDHLVRLPQGSGADCVSHRRSQDGYRAHEDFLARADRA